MAPLPQMQQPFPPAQPEQLFRWNANSVDGSGFVDSGSPTVGSFAMMPTQGQYGQQQQQQQHQQQQNATPSTALARRANNRALIPSATRLPFDANAESWNGFSEDAPFPPTAADENDNIERLEETAQRAKKEAQAKRKQIPPFVQKLSRYAVLVSA